MSIKASVLVINPNSSDSITIGMREALKSICPEWLRLDFYTAPSHAPTAIVDFRTMVTTATYCYDDLQEKKAFEEFDGFLVCCCKLSSTMPCKDWLLRTDAAAILSIHVHFSL